MTIDTATLVGDLAITIPGATRIFEQHRIDYCCGGAKSLRDACAARGVPLEPVVVELEDAARRARPGELDRWVTAPLSELVAYIVDKHHAYTRDEIERLLPLLDKVVRVHGQRRPELATIRATFVACAEDLAPHMMKEERVLFPYIDQLAKPAAARPAPPFGTVRNPVRMMAAEHDRVGELLQVLREQTHDYTPPPDACGSLRAVYAGLEAFERDMHEHIHLESNVLFPRAIAAESRQAAG